MTQADEQHREDVERLRGLTDWDPGEDAEAWEKITDSLTRILDLIDGAREQHRIRTGEAATAPLHRIDLMRYLRANRPGDIYETRLVTTWETAQHRPTCGQFPPHDPAPSQTPEQDEARTRAAAVEDAIETLESGIPNLLTLEVAVVVTTHAEPTKRKVALVHAPTLTYPRKENTDARN